MSRELILLGNGQGQSDADIDLEPLCRIKVSGVAGENPIVVFAAEHLGRQFIAGFRVGSHFSLQPISSLAGACFKASTMENQSLLGATILQHNSKGMPNTVTELALRFRFLHPTKRGFLQMMRWKRSTKSKTHYQMPSRINKHLST